MELLLAFLAVMAFLACVVVALFLRLVRLARSGLDRVRDRADLAVRARTGGSGGELARLRRDLARARAGARQALAVARTTGTPIGDVPALLAELERACEHADGELRMLAAQHDRGRLDARLRRLRPRVLDLEAAAAALVDGLLDAAGEPATEAGRLRAECAIERDALRAARGA